MNTKQDWILKARDKAQKDFQDHPESFLRGVTNHYSKTVDVYMRDEYQRERSIIISQLRS